MGLISRQPVDEQQLVQPPTAPVTTEAQEDRQMTNPQRRAPDVRSATLPKQRPSIVGLLPQWEGAPGYAPIVGALEETFARPAIAKTPTGVDIVSGADAAALLALTSIVEARPVHVGAKQLSVLPDWSDDGDWAAADTALRYADELRLPFDPLLLDFTEPNGEPCWLGEGGVRHGLYGALLARGQSVQLGSLIGSGELAIVPFGVIGRGPDRTVGLPASPDGPAMPAQAPLGTLIVTNKRVAAGGELLLGDVRLALEDSESPRGQMAALIASLAAEDAARYAEPGEPPQPFATPARVCVGSGGLAGRLVDVFADGQPGTVKFTDTPKRHAETVDALTREAWIVINLALISLRAMFLLDSANVELAPAPVSRQVRRAAERSEGKRKIAMSVQITAKPAAKQATSSGRRRDYQYAFERRGSYRHVTRGSHAKAELMRPCPRKDQAHEQSGGRCRREWVPPHIVGGGEGKPLILKTRRVS
jgi:hypothetical protein